MVLKYQTTFKAWQKKVGMKDNAWYWGGSIVKSSPNIVDDAETYGKLLAKARAEREVYLVLGRGPLDYQSP